MSVKEIRKVVMVALVLVASAFGCASTSNQTAPTPPSVSEKPASGPPAKGEAFEKFVGLPKGPEPVAAFDGQYEERADKGVITRPALKRFVSQGAGYALQLVRVQPSFVGGRFAGFQITGFTEEGSQLAEGVLQAGDVVVKVNRRPISRPEDFMEAWQSLSDCAEVSLQIVRDGKPMELIWPVEG